jgi:hypothetical protein
VQTILPQSRSHALRCSCFDRTADIYFSNWLDHQTHCAFQHRSALQTFWRFIFVMDQQRQLAEMEVTGVPGTLATAETALPCALQQALYQQLTDGSWVCTPLCCSGSEVHVP